MSHLHGIFPGLKWVSDDIGAHVSFQVAYISETWCWYACVWSEKWDEALRSQIQHFDFRYIRKDGPNNWWDLFVNKLWEVVRYIVDITDPRRVLTRSASHRTPQMALFGRNLVVKWISDC